ncbi:MATE family efflux transporter [Siphonobacter aquaeclarae]|uniref:Multidrug-efflux transporter n=1 Tax=Siphonobacter aquaeclarae TaxID=563176 RepID=A0A1G9SVG2_9BACT|nr:MATE family efflux transporter [Siphonobacter aquaeclarae]SDM39413.1 multidrug resistance protein, MATE family [Siphonobacter aquaeclarae]
MKQLFTAYFNKSEASRMLNLAWPIVLSQLGIMLMGVVDVIQVGHIATDAKFALDAAGIANGVWNSIAVFGINAIGIIAPQISKAREEGQPDEIRKLFRAGIRVALLATLFCSLIIVLLSFKFEWFGQKDKVQDMAVPYLLIFTSSTLPMFLFLAVRQLADGMGLTRVAMYITLGAVGLNILLNYLLIYGNWFFPELGLNGAALSTLISRIFMAIGIWIYVRRQPELVPYLSKPLSVAGTTIADWTRKIIRLGTPAGCQGFFEIAVFALAAIMTGWLGEDQLAAHLIAINPASVTYMMTTGLASAGGIRVGAGIGQGNREAVLQSGRTALLLAVVFMTFTCLCFLLGNEFLVSLYIRDEEVASIAVILVMMAGVFQLFDGVQAVSLGLLRGMADVNLPTGITLVAYWIVGLPVGYLFAFVLGMDALGIWIGLTTGLAVAAVLLSWRFFHQVPKIDFSIRRAAPPVGLH